MGVLNTTLVNNNTNWIPDRKTIQ